MISLRIPPELEKKLNSIALAEGKSRSEIIKDSISEYISKHEKIITPFELGKDLFGTVSSGKIDLSQNRKKYYKQNLESKNEKRRRSSD